MPWTRGAGARSRPGRPSRTYILNWRDTWHPEGGGSERYVEEVATRLAAAGVAVTVLTARYPGSSADEVRDGVRYRRRGGHLTVYLWTALLLAAARLGPRDAVLEVQNGMPFLARLVTRARVVVLVHHVHREQWPVVGPLLARIGWFLESRVAVRVNRGAPYVAVSEVTRHELVALGVEPKRITVAYNGLPEMPTRPRVAKTPWPSVVVLSRLVPHKQIEHAVRAVGRLAADLPDVRLTVLGSGWWAEQLESLTAELGLQERVHFAGYVAEAEKYERLEASWVHVLPSVKEGWGLSIIEAAQVGVPSVAYRSAGGVQESILDGVTGLLADDEEHLTECLRLLLTDAALREEMGRKAEARTDQLSWDGAAATIRGVLGV